MICVEDLCEHRDEGLFLVPVVEAAINSIRLGPLQPDAGVHPPTHVPTL